MPGLVTLYHVQPWNRSGLPLQPQGPHGPSAHEVNFWNSIFQVRWYIQGGPEKVNYLLLITKHLTMQEKLCILVVF